MGPLEYTPVEGSRVNIEARSSNKASPAPVVAHARVQTADYIADLCAELITMAQAADLPFLAHLLTMAQAEAEMAGEQVI